MEGNSSVVSKPLWSRSSVANWWSAEHWWSVWRPLVQMSLEPRTVLFQYPLCKIYAPLFSFYILSSEEFQNVFFELQSLKEKKKSPKFQTCIRNKNWLWLCEIILFYGVHGVPLLKEEFRVPYASFLFMGLHKHSSQMGAFGCAFTCSHTEFILLFPSGSPSGFITQLQQLYQRKDFCINNLSDIIICYNGTWK